MKIMLTFQIIMAGKKKIKDIPLTWTYSFICKCKAMLDMEIGHELNYTPVCLKCGSQLDLRYSIDSFGEIWMNYEILHE